MTGARVGATALIEGPWVIVIEDGRVAGVRTGGLRPGDPDDAPMTPHRLARIVAAATVLAALVPAVVLAHPLGNFTINHYAGLRVEPDQVLLDIVIDEAEIPAFQSRLDFDTDEDGSVSDEETDVGRVAEIGRASCRERVYGPV